MEIKHTVEILTKDIQEIEKLVRNLNNSPIPPRIELDLALSKLRNVYELLSMIRSDAEQEVSSVNIADEKVIEEPVPKKEIIVPQGPETIVDVEPVKTETPKEETVIIEKKSESVVDTPIAAQQVSPPQGGKEIEKPNPEPPKKKKEAAILAEKFNTDTSINDNIASVTKKDDVTSKISGQHIENIGRNIGINDRFLIIRELFDGNNDNYNHLINQLDASTNVDDAIEILKSTFPEDSKHEGYQLLTQLTHRKFI